MRRLVVLVLLLLAVSGLPSALSARAETRIALVLGNSHYRSTTPLDNPVNDAKLVSRTLRAAGFDVTELLDGERMAMLRVLEAFKAKAQKAGKDAVLVVFYAGHGVQIGGANFLVPIDSPLDSAEIVRHYTVPVDEIMRLIEEAGTRLNIVVLDACRTSPVRGARTAAAGLAQISQAPSGTLVAFSTHPHGVARDGPPNGNSPYTAALARIIAEPGLTIEDVFKRVTQAVREETKGEQVPWYSSSLEGRFYPAGPPSGTTESHAAREWQDVKDTTNVEVLERYLAKHRSDSVYAELARERIEHLKRQRQAGIAPSRQPAADTARPGDILRDCPDKDADGEPVCPELVVVPAATFMLGSPADEAERGSDEGPQRRVTIARPLAVGRFEITFAEWDACVDDGGCRHQPATTWGRGRQPVMRVSFDDVTSGYLPWLSRKTGRTYRLPSEAEWEYAARASTTGRFATGPSITPAQAGFDAGGPEGSGLARTTAVGSFPANAFGLHDMHGNVLEWVQDCYINNYQQMQANAAPTQVRGCAFRVVRGGSWFSNAQGVRSAKRYSMRPPVRDDRLGFRVVRDLVTAR